VFDLLPEQFIGDQFFESQKGAHSHDHDHDHDHDCDDPDHDHGPMAAQPRGQGGQAQGRLGDLLNFFTESQEYLERNVQPGDRDYDLKKEAMRPYLNGERPIFARVRTVTGIRSVLQYARNSKANIVLVGAPDAWKVADEIAEVGLPVILVPAGLSVLSANNTVSPWDPYDTPYATAELLRRAGVKFSFQSAGAAMAMTLPTRVGMSVGFGLPQEAAVRALTLSAAEILGVADELGSLDAGKRATFIVTDGDPFEQTSMVRYAFIDGKPVSLETKFTRLYQKYLERL
jgi:imidazolonepropionase-like amidohydrolase